MNSSIPAALTCVVVIGSADGGVDGGGRLHGGCLRGAWSVMTGRLRCDDRGLRPQTI
jgi:hypothetical protein